MKSKHLFWIVPAVALVAAFIGAVIECAVFMEFVDSHPVVKCIYTVDQAIPRESALRQMAGNTVSEYAERRCAETMINIDAVVRVGNATAGE